MMSKQHAIGRAPCINCGKTWGGHSGIHCWSGISARERKAFEPEGYDLSDICINCGRTLEEHRSRYSCSCNKKSGVFKKVFNMFNDRDFEL